MAETPNRYLALYSPQPDGQVDLWRPETPATTTSAEDPNTALFLMAAVSPGLGQAGMATAACALRGWATMGELVLRYQVGLMQSAFDSATGQVAPAVACRLVADDTRDFLRGITDAASQEARRLQQELEQVGNAVAAAADIATPLPHDSPGRRVRRMKR